MKLIVDDANIEEIKRAYFYFPMDGVTTNPSILAKAGRAPYETLTEIRKFIGDYADLHVQVVSATAEDMVKEAHHIQEILGRNTYIKIPTNREGIRAMRMLHLENSKVTATAIYTTMQAFLAAKTGADFAAPYINRIDNLGTDGIRVAKDIQDIFTSNNMNTQVLAASFKNARQIHELCAYGIGAVTVSADVMEHFLNNDSVEGAIRKFRSDFEGLCGENKTMLNCD